MHEIYQHKVDLRRSRTTKVCERAEALKKEMSLLFSVSNHKLVTRKKHANINDNEMNTINYYLYIFSFRVNQGSKHVINELKNKNLNVSLIVYIMETIEIGSNCLDKMN